MRFHVRYTCGSKQVEEHYRLSIPKDENNTEDISKRLQQQMQEENLVNRDVPFNLFVKQHPMHVARWRNLLIVSLPCENPNATEKYRGKKLRVSRTARYMKALLLGTA